MKHHAPTNAKFCGNSTTRGYRWPSIGKQAMMLGYVILFCGLNRPAQGQTPDAQLVLTGGTIYISPTASPITNGVVVIRAGKIAAVGRRGAVRIPKGVITLDCSGLTITAGFWNSHVHFAKQQWADAAHMPAAQLVTQLQSMLTRYGFTSVFDFGSPGKNTRQIQARIESGEVAGPHIRSTGEMLLGKGFSPPAELMRKGGFMEATAPPEVTPEVSNAAESLAAARQRLDAGADGLKFYAASAFPPNATLPDEVIRAVIAEAHRWSKPVFAHPQSLDGLLAAVKGGVDIIAHTTPPSRPWDEAVIAAMRQAKVALIPTLKVWTVLLRERAALREQWTQNNLAQLRAWLAVGGEVLFGTDIDAGMEDYDPSEEYALMAEAGMTFRHILAALTTAPARKFGAANGRIAIGLAADIVVLQDDPARDVRALAAVRYTIRNGKVIYQAE